MSETNYTYTPPNFPPAPAGFYYPERGPREEGDEAISILVTPLGARIKFPDFKDKSVEWYAEHHTARIIRIHPAIRKLSEEELIVDGDTLVDKNGLTHPAKTSAYRGKPASLWSNAFSRGGCVWRKIENDYIPTGYPSPPDGWRYLCGEAREDRDMGFTTKGQIVHPDSAIYDTTMTFCLIRRTDQSPVPTPASNPELPDNSNPSKSSNGSGENPTWAIETMAMINRLTTNIEGKAFDPDWFLLRQHLEKFEARIESHAATIREKDAEIAVLRQQLEIQIQFTGDWKRKFETTAATRDDWFNRYEQLRGGVRCDIPDSNRVGAWVIGATETITLTHPEKKP